MAVLEAAVEVVVEMVKLECVRRRAFAHDRMPYVDTSSTIEDCGERAPKALGLTAVSLESARGPSSSVALFLIADRRRVVNSLKSVVREW